MSDQGELPTQTAGGYWLDEVKSALQKAIRRGEEENALYWVGELIRSEREQTLWDRLRIIASEDVGLAAPVAGTVRLLYENWKDFKNDAARHLFTTHAALLLVRSSTSRIVDNAYHVAVKPSEPRREIPDEALDKHTARGRSMGRGDAHFFDEGAKLVNCKLPDLYMERVKTDALHK
jgi:replication-associated recombination protein RarA